AVTVRDDAIESLQRVAMLRPLPMPAIEALAAGSQRTSIGAGTVVFAEGEHGDRFYVIDLGDVTVRRGDGSTRQLGPGDCFGEIALLRDVPRTATVIAGTDLALRTIDRRHFLATVTGYGSSAATASSLVADRLADDAAPPPPPSR
ncbi:MAG: cyclic nucleotide-binding domain-containing protein, partial [Ilumatobacteraceae bacterium]